MSLTKKMQKQGEMPSGLLGLIVGKLMNVFHENIHKWGLQDSSIQEDFVCLDIGCGGGSALKIIAEKAIKGKTIGLDHSLEMVNLSIKLNKSAIAKGLVDIKHGSVSALPFSNNQFDLITAFETIQFWPDLDNDLKEIKRVLKPTGTFIVVNRYPSTNSIWTEFLQIKSDKDYKQKLESAGFKSISIDKESRKCWVLVVAKAK
jgi:ubiquinone/menaquinone biosynthesis C-methylase UbiE